MKVGVHISEAQDAADANRKAKLTKAYVKILTDYPAKTWQRRHESTEPFNLPRGCSPEGGAWMVFFEVEKKAAKLEGPPSQLDR